MLKTISLYRKIKISELVNYEKGKTKHVHITEGEDMKSNSSELEINTYSEQNSKAPHLELPKEWLKNTIQLATPLNTKRLRPLPTPFQNNGTIFELEEDKASFELFVLLKFPNGEMMLVSPNGREITMVFE